MIQECYEFALKILDDREEYDRESEAYRNLRGVEGVAKWLGSWEIIGSPRGSEFYILLEYGTCDLADFFEDIPPPSTPGEILKCWEDLCQIAVALNNIHNVKGGHTGRGYHLLG